MEGKNSGKNFVLRAAVPIAFTPPMQSFRSEAEKSDTCGLRTVFPKPQRDTEHTELPEQVRQGIAQGQKIASSRPCAGIYTMKSFRSAAEKSYTCGLRTVFPKPQRDTEHTELPE